MGISCQWFVFNLTRWQQYRSLSTKYDQLLGSYILSLIWDLFTSASPLLDLRPLNNVQPSLIFFLKHLLVAPHLPRLLFSLHKDYSCSLWHAIGILLLEVSVLHCERKIFHIKNLIYNFWTVFCLFCLTQIYALRECDWMMDLESWVKWGQEKA